jgi:hypothetical protein
LTGRATERGFSFPSDYRQIPEAMKKWFGEFNNEDKNAALQHLIGELIT